MPPQTQSENGSKRVCNFRTAPTKAITPLTLSDLYGSLMATCPSTNNPPVEGCVSTLRYCQLSLFGADVVFLWYGVTLSTNQSGGPSLGVQGCVHLLGVFRITQRVQEPLSKVGNLLRREPGAPWDLRTLVWRARELLRFSRQARP